MHSGKATDLLFCNEQLNKNVKCGKEYFTLHVSNIVLVIFKSFIMVCWGKKEETKKNRILNRNSNILVKNRNSIIFPNRSALVCTCVSCCSLIHDAAVFNFLSSAHPLSAGSPS